MNKQIIINYSDKITKWTLVSLAFLHPLLFNPVGYNQYSLTKLVLLRLATLILIVAWVVKASQKNRLHLVNTPLGLPLLCLALVVATSTIFSIHQLTSMYGEFNRYEGFLTILNYFLLYYLALLHFSSKSEKDYHLLIQAIFLSAALVSIYGIAQHFGFDFFQQTSQNIELARSFSTIGNPIFLGAFLSLVVPLLLVELLRGTSLTKSWFLSGLLALVGSCLVFTYSRAAWLGTALSVIILAVYTYQKIWQKKRVLLQITLAILVTVIISSLPGQTGTVKTRSVMERGASTFEIKEETASQRLTIWQATPAMIKTRPLVGFGPDTLRLVFPKYKSVEAARRLTEPGMVDKTHNNLLQTATTLGLLGLLFYLWLLITFFWKGLANLKANSISSSRWLQVGLLTATLGYVAQIQFSFSIIVVAPIFWLMVGLVASTWENRFHTLRISEQSVSIVIKYSLYSLLAIITVFAVFTNAKAVVADTYANHGQKSFTNFTYGEAAAQFEQAIRLNPSQSRYHLFLGTTYLKIASNAQAGSPTQTYWLNKAEKSIRDASSLNPLDEIPYLTLGGIYLTLGESENPHLLKKASFYFKKALQLDPNNYQTHFNLGTVYAQQGMLEKAISEWGETTLLNPSFSNAYYNLGQAFEEKGNLKKAELYYKKAVKLGPADLEAKKGLDRVRKARGEK